MKHFLCSLTLAALAWLGTTPVQAQAHFTECAATTQSASPVVRSVPTKKAAKQGAATAQTLTTCSLPYYVQVNVHFMLNSDGTGNFNEDDDGGSASALQWNIASQWMDPAGNAPAGNPLPALAPDANYNGYKYAEELINVSNDKWSSNPPMALPIGNSTPNPAKGVKFALKGVYFHRDADLRKYDPVNWYQYPDGVLNTAQFDTYGVNKSSELNIFIMGEITAPFMTPGGSPAPPNGQPNPDPKGRWMYISGGASGFGYSYNNIWFKAGNIWRNHLLTRVRNNGIDNSSQDAVAKMLNHEAGHLFNLAHPFQGGNGCADTPMNPSSDAGNNMMDYGDQSALTPCQIDIMQNAISTYYTDYYTCQGCMPANAYFTLPEAMIVDPRASTICPVLDGRASFAETSYSYSITPVDANNVPIGTTFTQSATGQVGAICLRDVYQFGTPTKKGNLRYAVSLTVSNSCTTSTMTKYLNVKTLGFRLASATLEQETPELTTEPVHLYPNPTTTTGFSVLSLAKPTELPVIRSNQGQLISVEQVEQQHDVDGWRTTYRFQQSGQQKPGLYWVEIMTEGARTVQQLAIESK